jgi:hypothetical protein
VATAAISPTSSAEVDIRCETPCCRHFCRRRAIITVQASGVEGTNAETMTEPTLAWPGGAAAVDVINHTSHLP